MQWNTNCFNCSLSRDTGSRAVDSFISQHGMDTVNRTLGDFPLDVMLSFIVSTEIPTKIYRLVTMC